jgi:hypothetical protein
MESEKGRHDISFTEASLDRLSKEQLADLVHKTVMDHDRTARLFIQSLIRSAIRSTARTGMK